MNATVTGWQSGSTVSLAPMLFPKFLNAMQGNSMYHFSSLRSGSTGHRTLDLLRAKRAFYHLDHESLLLLDINSCQTSLPWPSLTFFDGAVGNRLLAVSMKCISNSCLLCSYSGWHHVCR